jgi:hypothetical protein
MPNVVQPAAGRGGEPESADWLDVFAQLTRRRCLEARFLGGIRFIDPDSAVDDHAVVRASAALGIRASSEGRKKRLWIGLPGASAGAARTIAIGVLAADLVGRLEKSHSPSILGDIVLVTQQITTCRRMLDGLQIKNRADSSRRNLTDGHRIEPLIRRRDATTAPTLYLANPGRFGNVGSDRPFGAIVIDATHPRTIARLSDVLAEPAVRGTPIQVVIAPAGLERVAPADYAIWTWGPHDERRLRELLNPAESSRVSSGPRMHWLASDPPLEALLTKAHVALAGGTRDARGTMPDWLSIGWRLYHRMRLLAVDLSALDRACALRPFGHTARGDLEMLRATREPVRASAFWELHWPALVETLESTYEHLIAVGETAKFYELARAINAHFTQSDEPLRVVVGTSDEADLLEQRLLGFVDGYAQRLRDGGVRILSQAEEARAAAEEGPQHAVLLGPHTASWRYLDVYPLRRISLVTYEYESAADERVVRGDCERTDSYRFGRRAATLRSLGLVGPGVRLHLPREKAPPLVVERVGATQEVVERVTAIDVDAIAFDWSEAGPEVGARLTQSMSSPSMTVAWVEIMDTEGNCFVYPADHRVDLFVHEISKVRRVRAREVTPHSTLIVLVDQYQQSLFERLLEVLDRIRPPADSLRLRYWAFAKHALLREKGNDRKALFEAFSGALSVRYEAMVGWFGGDGDNGDLDEESDLIAPRNRSDFDKLAELTTFLDDNDRSETWESIRAERSNRRSWGRKLKDILVHSVPLLTSNRAPLADMVPEGTPLEEILAAAEVREVMSVRSLERRP